jgi:HD-GYP domain-containing protein (c-di-GMP phosphodiesterase class II)
MTTGRAYRAAGSERAALEELRRCAGTQFDPRVVLALETLVRTSRSDEPRREPRAVTPV